MPIAIPTIHLNGTSEEGLLEPIRAAHLAVIDAVSAVQAAGPNARDYYVQADPSAFRTAQAQHAARLMALQGVADELEAIGIAIIDQAAEREARKRSLAGTGR